MEILLFMVIFIFSIFTFSFQRKHFLMMLLSMEFIVLILYFMMFFYLMILNSEVYFSMIFLSLSVCESAMGLSLLVAMIRFYSSDNFNSLNLLW